MRCLAGFLLAALFLGLSGWLVTGSLEAPARAFDATIRTTARQIQSPLWTSLFLAATKLGSTVYLSVISVAAGLAFLTSGWYRALLRFILLMAGQAVLHHGFKWLIARPRPAALIPYPAVESFSFPSGHALSSLCLYGAIAWIISDRIENPALKAIIWIATLILILLIGLSRIYIGVHNATDVAAGFIAAAMWTIALFSAGRTD